MNYVLAPNDEGIIVTLKDVDEADKAKLDRAKVDGFDPTDEPFDKYYDYSKSIGFFVNRAFFDHAEHKGETLDFSEYLKRMSSTSDEAKPEVVTDSMQKEVVEKFVEVLKSFKPAKDPASMTRALLDAYIYISGLVDMVNQLDEADKPALHEAMKAAWSIYHKAQDFLGKKEFYDLLKTSKQFEELRSIIGQLQGKLLAKFHENF